MKKLFKLRYWFSILLPCLLIMLNACKKEPTYENLTDAQQIEQAKSWFNEQQKNQLTTFVNLRGKETDLTYVPDWDHAVVTRIDNATVITTSVKTNLSSVFGEGTQFNLVIKNQNEDYAYKTLRVKPNDALKTESLLEERELYLTGFTNDDLSSEKLNAEIKVYDTHFKSNGSILYTATGKTMIPAEKPKSDWMPYNRLNIDSNKVFKGADIAKTMASPGCYDAYMVTRVYEDGILVDIYQEYLGFEICPPNPDGLNPDNPFGSGDGNEGEYSSNEINISSETDNMLVSSSNVNEFTDVDGIVKRQWSDSWRFAKGEYLGYIFYGYSTELCTMKYVSGAWEWIEVTNQSYYTGGQRPDGTAFVKDGYAVNYYATNAKVQFTSHIDFLNNGSRSTTPKSAFHTIDKR